MNLTTWYFNQKGIRIFSGILIINLIILWLTRTFLMTDTVFYNTFSEQLTYERSLALFENMNRFSWITYILYPVTLICRVSLISIIVYLGAFLLTTGERITLSSVFRVVMASEVIFSAARLCKFLWFYFMVEDFNLYDIEFFYPLSIINFFSRSEVLRIWIYPLQTLNVFHLVYILFIAAGLTRACPIIKADSERVMLLSYVPALILWQVLIMFFLIGKEI